MSALYNSALRQSKAIRADLEAFSSSTNTSTSTSPSPPAATVALQGQLTTTLNSFARTLDDYQKAIDVELVPDKAAKGRDRLTVFRTDLLDFRARFTELKHEREQAQHAANRSDLLGHRRPYAGSNGAASTSTPENPYADAALTSRPTDPTNPLFRTENPQFQPGTGPNSYSAWGAGGGGGGSAFGLGTDAAREQQAWREQSFFGATNQTLDEYLERGRAVLGDLGDQREMLKRTQTKLYNIGNTLGISGDTIRMVERRAKQDKWIFWGGVVVLVVFVYLVLSYLR